MTREVIPIHVDDLERVYRIVEATKRKFDGSEASLRLQLARVADDINHERDQIEIAKDQGVEDHRDDALPA